MHLYFNQTTPATSSYTCIAYLVQDCYSRTPETPSSTGDRPHDYGTCTLYVQSSSVPITTPKDTALWRLRQENLEFKDSLATKAARPCLKTKPKQTSFCFLTYFFDYGLSVPNCYRCVSIVRVHEYLCL
jgi:hypothetical protein